MPTVQFFSPPDGSEVTDPDMDWLKDLILNQGEDYWNAGAGQGWLRCHNGNRETEMLLTFDKSLGFYLEYIDSNSMYYVSLGEGDFDNTVTVYVGGDPLLLPSAFFVPRDLAWDAVIMFCQCGARSESVRWGRRSEQNWHYGVPETP